MMATNGSVNAGGGQAENAVALMNADKVTRRDASDAAIDDKCGLRCGAKHLPCSPLQPLANATCTLIVFSLSGFLHQGISNGLIAVTISTLEKRFELRSTESALISSMSDFSTGACMLAIMFLSSRIDKPRMTGWGLVLVGAASIMFGVPHFIAPQYTPTIEGTVNFCGNVTEPDCNASSVKNYLYWFIACFLFIGAGICPETVYDLTYLDENVEKRKSAFYNGLYFAIGGLGPAVGFVVGGATLEMYTYISTDPSDLGIDSSNYSWVGAWWLGFMVAGALTILIAIPILMLPKQLPGTEECRRDRDYEAQREHLCANNENRSVFRNILSLLKNKPYLFVTLGDTMNNALVYGFNTFGAKYLESVFGLSIFHSSLLYGVTAVVAAFGAQVFSGWFVDRFALEVRGMLKFMIVAGAISVLCSFGFLVHCEDIDFAGATVPYPNTNTAMSLAASCNINCSCSADRYEPVCGYGVTHFSPCYAGCQTQLNETYFTECSCVMSNVSHVDLEAVVSSEACDWKGCSMITPFIIVVFICFFSSIVTMPTVKQVTLRCVPFNKRVMAISFQDAVVRIVGIVPGRLLVGYVLDQACVAWATECDAQGSCKVYSRGIIARNNTILLLAQTLFCVIAYALVLYTYKPVGKDSEREVGHEMARYGQKNATMRSVQESDQRMPEHMD